MADEIKAPLVDLGDGLYSLNGEPQCVLPVQAVEKVSDNEVRYDYGKYYLIITAEGSGTERHDFKWKREYK